MPLLPRIAATVFIIRVIPKVNTSSPVHIVCIIHRGTRVRASGPVSSQASALVAVTESHATESGL